MCLKLDGKSKQTTFYTNADVIVPFLVTPDTFDHPVSGTNANTLLTEKLPHHVLLSAFKQALLNKSHTVIT